MQITNLKEFSSALDFFCSDQFDDLEENEQEYLKKTLISSIDSIKDSRSEIRHAVKTELEIDGNSRCSINSNLKKISFIAFLYDEDKEAILKSYLKKGDYFYIRDDEFDVFLTLFRNISEELLIKVISESDHTKMFQIMSEINKRKKNYIGKLKKRLNNYYNIFRKALVD